MELTHQISTAPRRTMALACGVFLMAGITLAGLGPTLPHLAVNVGYDLAALGWLFTAISAGVVLAQFGAGPASDRLGQRPVLSAGMLLMSGGAVGVTLGWTLATLLAGALLIGIGFGCVIAAGNMLVAGLFPARSAAALNGVNVLFGIGSMIRPLLMVSLLGVLGGAALLTFGVGDLGRSVAGVLLLGLSCGPVFPTVLAVIASGGRASGTAASLVLALGNCGGLVIPALIGLLLSRYGPAAAAELVLGAAVIMVALCVVVVRSGIVESRAD